MVKNASAGEKAGWFNGRTPLFSQKDLLRLVGPLLIEQFLAVTVGMADTMMVSPLRRGGHLGRQPRGYDKQPHHRAVRGAGHRRRGGGEPVSGREGAGKGKCQCGPAHPAERCLGRRGGCGLHPFSPDP